MDAVLAVSRLLSYSLIALCFFLKLPQIWAVYSARSSRGVSARAYWMEITCYQIGLAYGYYHDYPISTYGENLLLSLQSYTILLLTIKYGRQWGAENALLFVVNGLFVTASVAKVIPPQVLSLLLASTIPLVIASRGTQIWELYCLKSRGDVSMAMFALAAYGCAARLFTIAVEVKDIQIFCTFLLSAILNSTIVAQCLYYGKGREKEKTH